jgi:spore maturation protein CgeB
VRFVMLYHSLISDWNHGNAHFLRGVVAELQSRGHEVEVCEPRDAWSVEQLVADQGAAPLGEFERAFPELRSTRYDRAELDLDDLLKSADVVIVHEWNDTELVAAIGRHRRSNGYRLLFHDTHHRSVTDAASMAAYDLHDFDAVLAYGESVREVYLKRGWAENVWTWHEAADTRVFHPRKAERRGDVVWVGNWGDDERADELREFLIEPVRAIGAAALIHGVRYPETARRELAAAGIRYGGWIANHRVPELFAAHAMTVHIPRRPYVRALRGIPTIRPFEALACGIPLVCAPWEDAEGLFTEGRDFLVARTGAEMRRHMRDLLHDAGLRESLAEHGLRTILERHTCAHRVDELLALVGGGAHASTAAV